MRLGIEWKSCDHVIKATAVLFTPGRSALDGLFCRLLQFLLTFNVSVAGLKNYTLPLHKRSYLVDFDEKHFKIENLLQSQIIVFYS